MRISDWSSDVVLFRSAAPGGADLAGARRRFAQRVEVAVKGQDQRAIVGDGEIVGVDLDPLAAQLGDLVAQRPGIEDDAVADDRQRAGDDAGGEQRQLVDLFAGDERMAGVVAALEADDRRGAARQQRAEAHTSAPQSITRISYD